MPFSPLTSSYKSNSSSRGGVIVDAAAAATVDPASKSTLPRELGMQELLDWLSTQLSRSDATIRAQMQSLTNSKDQAAALASIKSALDAAKAAPGDPKTLTGVASPDTIAKADWYATLEEGPIKDAVTSYLAKCNQETDGSWTIKGDDIKPVTDVLTDQISATTSRNEMDMIKLQSAISARGQMIQMISNMVAAGNETLKNISGNIRG